MNGTQTLAIHFPQVFSPTSAIFLILVQCVVEKRDVVPQRLGVPAVEVMKLREDVHLAFPGDFGIGERDEFLVSSLGCMRRWIGKLTGRSENGKMQADSKYMEPKPSTF